MIRIPLGRHHRHIWFHLEIFATQFPALVDSTEPRMLAVWAQFFRRKQGVYLRVVKFTASIVSTAILIAGCGTPSQGGNSSDSGKTTASVLGGLLGAAVGVAAADLLAKSEGKRLKLSQQEIDKRRRGYAVAFALMGGAGGAALSGTVYSKLSEQGRKAREQALVMAAQQARPQRYGEPTDSSIVGSVTPSQRYSDAGSNRECVDLEDALASSNSRDAIFVKMCRSLPSGGWQQVQA